MEFIGQDGLGQQQEPQGGLSLLTCTPCRYCARVEVTRECRCRSLWCGLCNLKQKLDVRRKLHPVVETWRGCLMVMLSLDRARYPDGPRSAWVDVSKRKCVPRLIERLHALGLVYSRSYVKALEFQMDETFGGGGGWPHWHLLVEADFIPHEKLVRLWGLGHVSLSTGRDRPEDRGLTREELARKAGNYVTNYITKVEEIPEWVMAEKGMRLFETSRGLLRSEPTKRDKTKRAKRRKPRNSIGHRLAGCQQGLNLWEVDLVAKLGGFEKRWRYKKPATEERFSFHEVAGNDIPIPDDFFGVERGIVAGPGVEIR